MRGAAGMTNRWMGAVAAGLLLTMMPAGGASPAKRSEPPGERHSVETKGEKAMATALLLIDIQNDYFPGGRMELVGSEEAASKARLLLDRFRKAGRPVIHVRHESTEPGATFFLPGTAGAQIREVVRPVPGEIVVTKHFPNAFLQTGLADRLHALGVRRIVAAGMMTHMCVDATVRAGADLGFEMVVASDACATRNLKWRGEVVPAASVQASFLAALASAYAEVLPAEEILKELGM